jgi:hypothetical protein
MTRRRGLMQSSTPRPRPAGAKPPLFIESSAKVVNFKSGVGRSELEGGQELEGLERLRMLGGFRGTQHRPVSERCGGGVIICVRADGVKW